MNHLHTYSDFPKDEKVSETQNLDTRKNGTRSGGVLLT